MRRYVKYLVAALVAVVTVTAILVMRRIPQTLPPAATSEVYWAYAGSDHLECTYFEGYQVNDTLVVPVTLLEAKDSAGWETLKEDFDIYLSDEDDELAIERNNNFLSMISRPKGRYSEQPSSDVNEDEPIMINARDGNIIIFHTQDEAQYNAIMWMYIDNCFKQQNRIDNYKIQDYVTKT